jgi:hypothetical protein
MDFDKGVAFLAALLSNFWPVSNVGGSFEEGDCHPFVREGEAEDAQ